MATGYRAGIYLITNTVDGKRYGGSAVDIPLRWRQHIRALNRNDRNLANRHLLNAWQKYGAAAFTFQVVIYCAEADLEFFERRLVVAYGLMNADRGYNIVLPDRSHTGEWARALWEDPLHREQMAASTAQRWRDPVVRAAMIEGLVRAMSTPEAKARTAAMLRARREDPVQREKWLTAIRELARRPDWLAGVRASTTRLWEDPAYRERVTEAIRAESARPERQARRADITRSHWSRPDYREKVQAGIRESWADDPERRQRFSELGKAQAAARRAAVEAGELAPPGLLITANGETRNIAGWAKVTGLTVRRIRKRRERGWSDEDSVLTPLGATRGTRKAPGRPRIGRPPGPPMTFAARLRAYVSARS